MAITLGGTDKLISVSLPHVTIAVSLGISGEEAEPGLRPVMALICGQVYAFPHAPCSGGAR